MGHGDIRVAGLDFKKIRLTGICFGECESGKISRKLGGEGLKDYEVGIKVKLTFIKSESIDVVINALNKAKKYFIEKDK